jgi:hypothetical protein
VAEDADDFAAVADGKMDGEVFECKGVCCG